MTQRQVAEHPVVVVRGGDDGQDALDIGEEVAMGEHHAFGVARGAGSIDDGDHVVGGDAGLDFLEVLWGRINAPELDNGIVIFKDVNWKEMVQNFIQTLIKFLKQFLPTLLNK